MEKQEKDDSYSHILKYTSLFGGVQGLSILVGIVRNKLVAMILGPEGMGLVSLFNSTIKLVSDSTNFGLSMSAVKRLSEAFDAGSERAVRHAVLLIRSWSLLTALLGMAVCVILSPLLNKWTFSWGDHTLHFVLLSPVVALMAVTAGEMAVLKGARRLKQLAVISVYNVVLALLFSVPIYYEYGQAGIVPSLFLLALVQALLVISCSYRLYPPRFLLSKKLLREGRAMIRLGLAFVVAGILGSGAEFIIRSFLNMNGNLTDVGLYNAGYVMTMTYAGMVFSAMETDYFPRLSSYRNLGPEFNRTVNHQIEVSLLLVSPMLVVFMVALPVLLPLLYSGKFMPVLDMMRVTVLAMYFRAITLPVEYIALARGDSYSYLFLEAVFDVAFCLAVIIGYYALGLLGTGIGIVFSAILNTLVVFGYAQWKYHYALSSEVKHYCLAQLPIGLLAFSVGMKFDGFAYWVTGIALGLLSLVISVSILRSKSNLWHALKQRALKKLNR